MSVVNWLPRVIGSVTFWWGVWVSFNIDEYPDNFGVKAMAAGAFIVATAAISCAEKK